MERICEHCVHWKRLGRAGGGFLTGYCDNEGVTLSDNRGAARVTYGHCCCDGYGDGFEAHPVLWRELEEHEEERRFRRKAAMDWFVLWERSRSNSLGLSH